MAIGDTLNQNPFGTDYNREEEEEKKAELAAQNARIGAGNVPALDSNIVAQVPGIENIKNPGAFDPTSIEPVEPVGPPTTVLESIKQTYDESVLADLINKGFGQEAFQSQAPDGTPTFSIFNKRFGILGSQVPYSEASPEAKQQAMNFMIGTGGQERPLPETPTSPVRTPEQVQSILDKQRAAQAASNLEATQGVAPPVETPSEGAQGQGMDMNQSAIMNALTDQKQGMDMNQQAIANAQGQEATVPPPAQTLSQFMRYEDAPEQRTEQFLDEQGRLRFRPTQEALQLQAQGAVAQPPVDALSSFEKDSLARQQRIGGTGSFEGDSEARDARVRASDRQPGETQADRDTRIAQSRTTGGQTEGLSFDDARRRAEGDLAERGVRNPSASQVNALARALQAEEPERLAELETKRAINEARLKTAQATLDRPEFEGKVYTVNGVTFAQTSRGGAQVIDTGTETSEESTAKMKDFVFALEQIDKARQAFAAGDVDKANDIITAAGIQKNGFDVTASEYFGGLTEQQEANITRQAFDTMEEAEAANLPEGTKITIGGRNATV
jgi:hypothetical protein